MERFKPSPVLAWIILTFGSLYLLTCLVSRAAPLHWVFGATSLLLGIRAMRMHRLAALAQRSETCTACGDDLRGLPIANRRTMCPECGHQTLREAHS